MHNEYLFVYGNLKRNQNSLMSSYLNNNAKFIGDGYTLGRLYNLGSYPGYIPSTNSNEKVFGEIFELQNTGKILDVLDDFEESWPKFSEDAEYKRLELNVYFEDSELLCWVYVYNWAVDDNQLIKSGIY
jgi:gamma-glutamylcyclotransferase (GGCT)/AIG2-like uncharacterized protein YtfP